MSKQKKSEKSFFNGKSKELHKKDVKAANTIEYRLQRVGYLHKITLCDY